MDYRNCLAIELDYFRSVQSKKENFKSLLNSETKIAIDYSIFQNNPQESVGLMVDLIALAKRDNDFDFSEKLLIKEIGKKVGFGDSDISELMS